MHTLLFLDPGHFHAALALRSRHPEVSDEIVVHAPDGPERRDFLALIERFNARAERPTRWRPAVLTSADPLSHLVDQRRGDVVVLAGKNGGKARAIRRLHEAGFHVLADKPWLVEPADLEPIRQSLAGWPLAMEMLTGRHDLAARLVKRLIDLPDVFGEFEADAPGIELDSVHHLEKLVDGAPLRRPWWFFDVRVQGSGAVDIPTHLVDQTQWLVDTVGSSPGEAPRLIAARAWTTRVPLGPFCRITGEPAFPPGLGPFMDGGALEYPCNAELTFRIAGVTARASARWELSAPSGGGDTYRAVAHGTRADVVLEQGPHTGGRRQLAVEPRDADGAVARRLGDALAAWHDDVPGLRLDAGGPRRHVVRIPPDVDAGHESHFALVLDAFLDAIDQRQWPATLSERTLAKYTLLAAAADAIRAPRP